MAIDVPFDYEITRSRRKSLAIYVRHGRADVRAPLRAPKLWIEAFLQQKVDWIVKQIDEQQRKASERFNLRDGEEILYLGKPLRVCITPDNHHGVRPRNDSLLIPANDLFNRSEDYFHDWLRQQAIEYMLPRARALAEKLDVASRLQDVRWRKTKTKWGHCSSEGIVQFNWLIMLAPPNCVDYLIAHEICHLRHMNHSKTYWALVQSVCPHHQASRKWIRNNEHRLLI